MAQVSVIIPVYNAAGTLSRCLDSVLDQDYLDWEVILVNDGSTDDSPAICDAYALRDSRIKVFHKENGGVSRARNLGLENASGDWITFLDSDDWLTPCYFPLQWDPSIDLYLQRWRFEGNSQPHEVIPPMTVRGEAYLSFLRDYVHWDICRSCCAKFIKREIVEKYGIHFDTNIRLGEDTLFFMDYYARCASAAVLHTGCYVYNRASADAWENKYRLSPEEVQLYFDLFLARYHRFPVPCPSLAAFVFGFFPCFLSPDDRRGWDWRLHPSVLKMRRIVCGHSFSQRLKGMVLELMSSCAAVHVTHRR